MSQSEIPDRFIETGVGLQFDKAPESDNDDAKRSCGACSMCCYVPPIDEPEIKKEANVWCRHCRPGHGGCSIYEQRPASCCGQGPVRRRQMTKHWTPNERDGRCRCWSAYEDNDQVEFGDDRYDDAVIFNMHEAWLFGRGGTWHGIPSSGNLHALWPEDFKKLFPEVTMPLPAEAFAGHPQRDKIMRLPTS